MDGGRRRCPKCGARAFGEWDVDLHVEVPACFCGWRDYANKEEGSMPKPSDAAMGRALAAFDDGKVDPATGALEAFTLATRKYLDLSAKHRAAVAEEARLRAAVDQAQATMRDTRRVLDEQLGEAPAEPAPAVGVCTGRRRVFSEETKRKIAEANRRRAAEKAAAAARAPAEVPAEATSQDVVDDEDDPGVPF